jgi:predicted transcriptional regulator
MIATGYSQARSKLAKASGFGTHGGALSLWW